MGEYWIELTAELPNQMQWIMTSIATAIIVVTILLSHYVGRLIAPAICQFIEGHEEIKHIDLLEIASSITGNLVSALILAGALYLYPWGLHPQLLLTLAMTLNIAAMAQRLLRGLNIGFWSATAVSFALFIWTVHGTLTGFGHKLSPAKANEAETIGGFPISLEFLITAVLVVIIFIAAIRLGGRFISLLLERNSHIDDGQRVLVEKLANVAMIVVGFLLAMDILGIDLTALAFFSGAFGLAIGFGLQKTFGNLISGIILLMDRSIKPGDVIAVGDSFGWVNKIGIRAVSIITRDGKEHLIPNENMMTNEVENWSYSSKNVRVRIPVGVAYNSDIVQVEELLLAVAKDHKRVLKQPIPRVLIKGFGDNSVDFEFRIWIRDPEEGVSNIKSDILKQIWHVFHEHGVEFPFPQRDVHLDITPSTLKTLKGVK